MCLAVPVRVLEVLGESEAIVDLSGVRSRVSTLLVDDLQPGDYVIMHVGHAIARLDVDEAERTLSLFREIADHLESEGDALHR
ncbi:MAG: HypC/HybG/HupF family hydrogenase formation chaperone [Pseudomonadales bacterium]|nr:HypC/HybG/HupF family hydrogenase formation chaperone [Pseudomonadales bacterium]